VAALTRLRNPALWLLAALLALAISGCVNPFRPATPEPPDPNSFRADYSTPKKLVSTLEAALENKGPAGAVAWIDAMASPTGSAAPGFIALHDPIMLDRWKASSTVTPPDPWNYDLEKTFYSSFISSVYPLYPFVASFTPDSLHSIDDELDETDNLVLLHRKYYIAAILPDNEAKIVAIGIADLSLVKTDDGLWHVLQWKDRLDPTVPLDPASDQVPLGWRRLEYH
jgi:hypothetical protein